MRYRQPLARASALAQGSACSDAAGAGAERSGNASVAWVQPINVESAHITRHHTEPIQMEGKDLRNAGLKVTLPRLKILEILEGEGCTGTSRPKTSTRPCWVQTRTSGSPRCTAVLTQFEAAGLVTRHHFENGMAVFELNRGDHHDHIVCIDCGKVEEFVDAAIEERQKSIAARAWLRDPRPFDDSLRPLPAGGLPSRTAAGANPQASSRLTARAGRRASAWRCRRWRAGVDSISRAWARALSVICWAAQHARHFLHPLVAGEFREAGARGLAVGEFQHPQVVMSLRGHLRQVGDAQHLAARSPAPAAACPPPRPLRRQCRHPLRRTPCSGVHRPRRPPVRPATGEPVRRLTRPLRAAAVAGPDWR